MSQLPADCLNEIFKYLEHDKVTLHSCLLVNRLWCDVSVRILWRNIWNYNTLIAYLPNSSKEILYKNGIIISTPASKSPIFNYAAFCMVLSINQVNYEVERLLENQQSQNLNHCIYIVTQEIFKLLMSQIPALKKLDFYFPLSLNIQTIALTSYPGAKECLKNLSELNCRSDIYPEIFYQLTQICHNLLSLRITFEEIVSFGLTDLISVQKNLNHLSMQTHHCKDLAGIIPSLTNLNNTLVKFNIYGGEGEQYIPLTFIAKFTNLRELVLSFCYDNNFEDFRELQYVTFSQLQILKFQYGLPRYELLIKFLENSGKNLKELYLGDYSGNNDSLNFAIANFCPNLRILSNRFKNMNWMEH